MKSLVEHMSGAGLIVSDMTPEEVNGMLGMSDIKLFISDLRDKMEVIHPGKGKYFGAFRTETEAKKFRRQIAARARDLKWYEAYGQRTPKGQWKSPYRADHMQVKFVDKTEHPEFANTPDDQWVVKILRFPINNNNHTPSES